MLLAPPLTVRFNASGLLVDRETPNLEIGRWLQDVASRLALTSSNQRQEDGSRYASYSAPLIDQLRVPLVAKQKVSSSYLVHAALAAICYLLAGCGGGGSGGTTAVVASGTASLSVDQSSINFGKAVIGQTSDRTVTISNTGTVNLNITATDPGDGFSFTGSCAPLAPQQSCKATVQFAPTEQKDYTAQLTINSEAPSAQLSLAGKGQGLNTEISSVSNSCVDSTVTIKVLVSGADGRAITNLDASKFVPSVNGVALDAFNFAGAKELEPVSVGLAVDWSGSVKEFADTIVQQSDFLIDQFRATDTAALFRFAKDIDANAQDFVQTDDAGKATLSEALRRDFVGDLSNSLIWDATNYVVNKTKAQPNPKRAVILLTDGNSGRSQITLQNAIDNAKAKNVSVFTIGFGPDVNAADLQNLAQETGGVYLYTPDAQDLQSFYEQIASVLTNEYEMSFTNPSPATSNQLTVLVRDAAGNEGSDTLVFPPQSQCAP